MAVIPTQSFDSIVARIAAGMQGRVSRFLNFAVGSVFLAWAEAVAGVCEVLQRQALEVALLTRLATSYGSDVDSFMADWDLVTRIGSVPASGLVSMGRKTAGAARPQVLVGASVKTTDGKTTFQVYADATNAAFDSTLGPYGGYTLGAYVSSFVVPVVCVTPSPNGTIQPDGTIGSGANGNVAAGTITLLASQITGIDTVTNLSDFTNGIDQESDDSLKDRWRLTVGSLSDATIKAIKRVIGNIQPGMQVQVLSNQDPDGTDDPGMISVIVDDGSGAVGPDLLAQATAAANGVKAAGTRMGVYAAQKLMIEVELTIFIKPGFTRNTVAPLVSNVIANNINITGLDGEIDYFTIGSWALSIPGVAKIEGLTVNGADLDTAADPRYTPKCAGVVVN